MQCVLSYVPYVLNRSKYFLWSGWKSLLVSSWNMEWARLDRGEINVVAGETFQEYTVTELFKQDAGFNIYSIDDSL